MKEKKDVFKMANLNLKKEMRNATKDIQKLEEETAKMIQDFERIQNSAISIRGRLKKAASAYVHNKTSEKYIKKLLPRSRKSNTEKLFSLCAMRDYMSDASKDSTCALRTLKYIHEDLINALRIR